MELVSILIPVYNREKYIVECIESAISQDYKNIEIIISDNCSTDKSWEIIEGYQKKCPNIIINRNSENLGPINNWKKCFSLSKGNWIKFLFSDDKIDRTHIARLLDLIGNKENVTGCFSPAIIFDDNTGMKSYSNDKEVFTIKDVLIGYLFGDYNIPVSPCAGIFKRDIVEKSLEWSPSIPEALSAYHAGYGVDMMIYLNAAREGLLIEDKEASVYFRKHPDSITISTGRNYALWGYRAPILDLFGNKDEIDSEVAAIFLSYAMLSLLKADFNVAFYFLKLLSKKSSIDYMFLRNFIGLFPKTLIKKFMRRLWQNT